MDPFLVCRPVVIRLLCALLVPLIVPGLSGRANAGPGPNLEEDFRAPLSADWFWSLGTWRAQDGVLRGFESGPRRHGPVTVRRFAFTDAVLSCQFRMEGRASFAGIIFNGSQERGHLVHLVMGRDRLRILAHPGKGQSVELLSQPHTLRTGEWYAVRMEFRGPVLTAEVNGSKITATHACIGESKVTFGLGGESGGPGGEQAGALEFRNLRIAPLAPAS